MCYRNKRKGCEWNLILTGREVGVCFRKNCSLDCSANVRQAGQSGKDCKLKGQCVKKYKSLKYMVFQEVQLSKVRAYFSRIIPTGEEFENEIWHLMIKVF